MTVIGLKAPAIWYRIHYRNNKERLVEGEVERDRVLALRRPKAITYSVAQTHQCGVCPTIGPWTPSWSWWGSWKQIDDGRPVKKFCSPECRTKWRSKRPPAKNKRLARYEPNPGRKDEERWNAARIAREATGAHRKFEMPEFPKIADLGPKEGQCRWCGERITGPYAYQRSWHTRKYGDPRDCKREWLLHTDREAQYWHLIQRDGPGCADCGRGDGRWEASYQFRDLTRIKWSVYLEVDHETPLYLTVLLDEVELRRSLFGPLNQKLRCQPCHKRKCALEAKDRSRRGL